MLAAGRPIVYQGNPSGEIVRMIQEERIGCVVGHGDTDALEQALRDLLKSAADREAVGRRARALAERRFAMEQGIKRYLSVLVGGASKEGSGGAP